MTRPRIDLPALSFALRNARESWDGMNVEIYDGNYRAYLRDELKGDSHLWQPRPARTAEVLRRELTNAAMVAQDAGATKAQIDYIIELAIQAGDFTGIGSGLLTKRQASNIIDDMKRR